MIPPFTFDRSFEFALAPGELWARLDRLGDYQTWWRWLRAFDADGATGLAAGVEAECVVRGPLPYSLRFTVSVLDVVAERLVDARVSGDLDGPARLELEPTADGTSARLVWAVQVVDPALRATARVARPVMEWGHDFVVTRGVQGFRRRGLAAG